MTLQDIFTSLSSNITRLPKLLQYNANQESKETSDGVIVFSGGESKYLKLFLVVGFTVALTNMLVLFALLFHSGVIAPLMAMMREQRRESLTRVGATIQTVIFVVSLSNRRLLLRQCSLNGE